MKITNKEKESFPVGICSFRHCPDPVGNLLRPAIIALTIFVLRRAPIGRKTGIVFMLAYLLYMAAIARDMVGAAAPL